MKASRKPSPLREFRFEPDMRLDDRYTPPPFAAKTLSEKAAAALRQQDQDTELWVQLHLGFLCLEAGGRQVGRQPGHWAWADRGEAMRFMGSLEAGQCQPAILSTWCVCWPDKNGKGFVLGPSVTPGLAGSYWWVDPFGLMDLKLHCAAPGATEVRRLRVGREYQDTCPEAWTNALP